MTEVVTITETSLENQWPGCYMIGTSIMKEVKGYVNPLTTFVRIPSRTCLNLSSI